MDELILQSKVKELLSHVEDEQLSGMKFFQAILSVPDPDIKRVLKLDIVSRVIELMNERSDDLFNHYAAWFLINFATSNSTHGSDAIVQADGLKTLISVFDKSNIEVKVQAIWALTNVFQDSQDSRNKVISMGILPRTIALLREIPSENFDWIQIILWTLFNLLDMKFYPPMENFGIKKCLKIFIEHFDSPNDAVKLEALKGITAISENKNFNLEIDEHIPCLIDLINGEKKAMRKEALRIIGNIAYTKASTLLIEYNVVNSLKNLLWVRDVDIIKESCWILSNICADRYINQLFEVDLFPRILELLTHNDRKIRRESAWVVANTCKSGSFRQIKKLVVMEVLKQLTKLLDDTEDKENISTACETIFAILKKGHNYFHHDVNLFAILVDKYGALKKIEYLQFHKSDEIVLLAIKILGTFFRQPKPSMYDVMKY